MAPWFRRQKPKQAPAPEPQMRFDPETVAFDWSGMDPMTIRHLCEGMFIAGATGAGKSSTTFRLATESLLRLGAGGVFTTTKPGDAEFYARSAGGPHAADLELSEEFWLLEFAGLASRTRSIIVSVATAALSPFLRDPLRTLFSTGTTICPEMAAEGAVFLLDLPVKMWNEQGRLAQCLFKLCFQRAIERRLEAPNRRPVFLAIDEYQHFVAESDIGFAATARSAGVCTIYATQNLQILYAAFARAGGDGKHSTHALLGNLSTKVFHAQTDQETNQFAADLLGKVRKRFGHASVTIDPQIPLSFFGSARPVNAGSSEQLVHDVEPHEFATLQKGGPENAGMVTAIVFQNGRTFSTGRTWLPVAIRQEGS